MRRLLEAAPAVEAGKLDGTLVATSQDEIGHADHRVQSDGRAVALLKERLRETFENMSIRASSKA